MTPYFITGLPRSRTAWLANYLSYGESLCLHDAFVQHRNMKALRGAMEKCGVAYVGHADPANCLFWEAIQDEFPGAKWVVVQRDEREAAQAAVNAFDGNGNISFFVEALKEVAARLNPLIIDYDDLDLYVDDIAGYCVPGLKVPLERKQMLAHFNVQIDRKHLHSELNRLKGELAWA